MANGPQIHLLIGTPAWSRPAAERVVSSLVDKDDPLNPVSLIEEQLRADPARLLAELSAVPMFGGRAVVWVRGGGTLLCRLIEEILDGGLPEGSGVLVAEIEALPAQSELSTRRRDARLLMVTEPVITPQMLARELAADRGLRLDPAVVEVLIELTGGDRGMLTSELDKLASFSGSQGEDISADTIIAVCGDAGLVSVEGMVAEALAGNIDELGMALIRGRESGTTGHQIASGVVARLFRDLRVRGGDAHAGMAGHHLALLVRDIFEMQRDTRLASGFDVEIAERLLLRFAAGGARRG